MNDLVAAHALSPSVTVDGRHPGAPFTCGRSPISPGDAMASPVDETTIRKIGSNIQSENTHNPNPAREVLKATNSAARQTFLLQSELSNGPTGNSAPKHLQSLGFYRASDCEPKCRPGWQFEGIGSIVDHRIRRPNGF
uniref:hypothetical protein n=1 Tax=Ensifer adhaerens TaxID=106592 RepID=UPI003F49152F